MKQALLLLILVALLASVAVKDSQAQTHYYVYTLDKHYFGGDELIVWAWYWPRGTGTYQVYLKGTPEFFNTIPLFKVCAVWKDNDADEVWSHHLCWDPPSRVWLPILTFK